MADQKELTISDIHGSVTRDSPDVYITFRVGDQNAETPVRLALCNTWMNTAGLFCGSMDVLRLSCMAYCHGPWPAPVLPFLSAAGPLPHAPSSPLPTNAAAGALQVIKNASERIAWSEPVTVPANHGGRGSRAKPADLLVVR